ncbi:MAG: pyruvate ferredoxin oxidoreductase [Deltaproteobacteria bacterium]|nr:pyruvate ferredoxin oxidoreductase [Deltaproteobacteria bacterium]MBI3077914.1 pyruvate ferredoxin oxidoreductase [Deltaproteobacteria bacterium]
MASLREISERPDRLSPGHRLCAGCGASIVVRQVLLACEEPVVVANATGCLEVATTLYPYTAWRVPWIHSAFENTAATISGVEAMYRVLRRKGRLPHNGPVKFLAFAGDGGTYDIGLQALSGALERGHSFLYVCYNNEAYMNTGIQRSSATPLGAHTTTAPAGRASPGKLQPRKDLTAIVAAHRIPYAAQASVHLWHDLMGKVRRALAAEGPTFLNVLAPCPRGWRHATSETIDIARLAVECGVWPIYEVAEGRLRITHRPRTRRPVTEWLASQGRFAHLLEPGHEALIEQIEREVEAEWERLQRLERLGAETGGSNGPDRGGTAH